MLEHFPDADMSGSSLKYFAKAKTSVAEIVSELLELLNDSIICASEVRLIDGSILTEEDAASMCKLTDKIKGIFDILQRNSMKVVFFGRTSNGKSTAINAMLKDKILPSGIGHTTNCFVQVEGVDGTEAYIVTEKGGKESVQSLRELASALSKVKLDPESLIKIHWPKHKCRLLREGVILVDSPGIDLSADVDEWIDKFCLDADVFVLVANAESTIMQTEKNFFHRVSSKLSKPNIFILNNRWDASAYEIDTKKEVRQQHIERCTSFLVDELQVIEPNEVDKRLFFVSALETLQFNNAQHSSQQQSQHPSEGIEERLDEFVEFEKCFEDCISRAAVATKFAKHTRNIGSVATSLTSTWDNILTKIEEAKNLGQKDFVSLRCRLDFMEEEFVEWEKSARISIKEAAQLLKIKMSQSLTKELRYLYNILEEYTHTFDPDDEETMKLYKKDLNFYVEENLTKNLHVSHTPVAKAAFLNTCEHMIVPVSSMIATPKEEVKRILVPCRNFEVAYNLDCTGLCSRFIEDIDFRFSLGFTSLLAKYLGKSTADDYEETHLLPSSSSSSSLLPFTPGSTIGFLLLLSAVARTVGRRVLGICFLAYAALYIYERLSWTNKMKEQTFKRQYISFATHQLRMVMDIISINCSQQVERELTFVMRELSGMIIKHRDLLKKEIQESEVLINRLESVLTSASTFRSKFYDISRRLEEFQTEYLSESS